MFGTLLRNFIDKERKIISNHRLILEKAQLDILHCLFCFAVLFAGFGEICLGCSSGSCSRFVLYEMEKVLRFIKNYN